MEEMNLKALAKINLALDVVRRRENGYHEVRMVMQTISLYDRIQIVKKAEPGIEVQTNLSFLPVNENNLVYKAAKLLIEKYGIRQGVKIVLEKYIPVAAGLAGGSSDAAAVLVGMNRMFGLNVPKKELMELGVKIGADVPYCIMRGTALAEGIGEELTPIAPMPKCHILIAKPGINVSTKFVYENLQLEKLRSHPDIDGMIAAIEQEDLRKIAAKMENVLESVTVKAYPVIAQIKEVMREQGALNALMSGSGPTVFGLYDDLKCAKKAYQILKSGNLAKKVYLTNVYNNRR